MRLQDRFRWFGLIAVVVAVLISFLWGTGSQSNSGRASNVGEFLSDDDYPSQELSPWSGEKESKRERGNAEAASLGIHGTVRSAKTGQPIGGAQIVAVNPELERITDARHAVTSDERGRFVLEERPSESTHLQACATGYAAALIELPEAPGVVEFLLSSGERVGGKVLDDCDRPVPGVRVWLHRPSNQVAWRDVHPYIPVGEFSAGGNALTNDRGEFLVEGLQPGSYQARATKSGYSCPDWEQPPTVEAGHVDLTLRMIPFRTIVIRHFDAETGKPLRCVLTQIQRPHATVAATPLTADIGRGEAMLDGKPEGFDSQTGVTRTSFAWKASEAHGPMIQTVTCQAPGYEPFEAKVDCSLDQREILVDAPMRRRVPQVGRLRLHARFNSSDLPYAGALQVMIDDESGSGRGITVLEFRDGQAIDALVLPEGRYKLRPMGSGDVGFWWLWAGQWDEVGVVGGAAESKGRMQLTGTPIRLRVVDKLGRPVRGYDLKIFPSAGRIGSVRRWDTPGNHVWLHRWAAGYEGPDIILSPGVAKVSVSLTGVRWATAEIRVPGDGRPLAMTLSLD